VNALRVNVVDLEKSVPENEVYVLDADLFADLTCH
jgi:hypothetical protein